MKTMDYFNLLWLVVAMSAMIFMSWTMWKSHQRSKEDHRDGKRRMEEMHDLHIQITRLQLKKMEQLLGGKEIWDL